MGAAATPAFVSPKPGEDRVGIFISHKHEDCALAMEIKQRFEMFAPNRLDVYVSELIPKGEKWDPRIHQWLKESHWLILLYTGSGADWDWCFYEIGFFVGAHETGERHLVCLHHEGVEPPGPLKAWQSTTESNCATLLRDIFREPWRAGVAPLNSHLTDQALNDVARNIMRNFTERRNAQVLTPYIELAIGARQRQELLNSATLAPDIPVATDARAREIFDLAEPAEGKGFRWDEVSRELEETRQQGWIRNLADTMRRHYRGKRISTTFPVLFSVTEASRRRWRPILYSVRVGAEDTFKIIFSEILPEDDPRPEDPRLDHCMALMSLMRMMRFGVIDKYRPLVRQWKMLKKMELPNPPELDEAFAALPATIERIQTEAQHSGLRALENITNVFKGSQGGGSGQWEAWTIEWVKCRTRLNRGVADRNVDEVEAALEAMRNIVRETFRLIAQRYCELIDELR